MNKFRKGDPYEKIEDVAIDIGLRKWIYLGNRPKHFGWIQSMTFRTIMIYVERKALCRAIEND